MSILVVGGHERMEKDYLELGKKSGFKTKVCTKKANKLASSIGNPDAVVILTSTVSHKICNIVEMKAKKQSGFKTKVCTKKANKLASSIGNPDAVVILTSTVSHKICNIVEMKAKKQSIPIFRKKSSSKSAFSEQRKLIS